MASNRAKKTRKALGSHERLANGNFLLPSPGQIEAAMTPAGGWTAKTLAGWGVKWELGNNGGGPPKGWRFVLTQMFHDAGGVEGRRHNFVLDYASMSHLAELNLRRFLISA